MPDLRETRPEEERLRIFFSNRLRLRRICARLIARNACNLNLQSFICLVQIQCTEWSVLDELGPPKQQRRKTIKSMKSLSLTLIAIIAVAALMSVPTANAADKTAAKSAAKTSASAKQTKKAGAKAGVKQGQLKQLNLSADQKAKLKPILEEAAQKTKALRDDANLSPEAKRAKLAELREATNAKVKAILTPEQAAKWEQAKNQTGKAPKNSKNAKKKDKKK